MTVLTVGPNQQFSTIAAAVAASATGDTIDVAAGTYTNDFPSISHNLTIQAVGGTVNLVATVAPPNGKGIIEEGGSGVSVTINGLSFSGAAVSDNNGAGIRYDGGTLTLSNDTFTGNQNGILAAADPTGVITISNSTFNMNGAGDGHSHNLYIGAIASLTVQNSTIENAVVGHDIKSRAASTTITGNTITDVQGTASYEIDLPNGGNAVINNNTIEKGANASNPIAISYGEEGGLYAAGSLSVTNNLLVNDDASPSATAVKNATGATATVSGDTFYGWVNLYSGPVNASSNTVATSEPPLTSPSNPAAPVAPGNGTTTLGSGPDTLALQVSEDAWQGDAQFTVAIDGQKVGGTQTATASHAAGQTQLFDIQGTFGAGGHSATVTFLNDAWGGTSATDRNLYVTGATLDGTTVSGAVLNEYGSGPQSFGFMGKSSAVTVGSGSQAIVLQMSEDAWQGDAQFTVAVDGTQVGGAQTVTASHAAGQSQEFDVMGAFANGAHQVAISFINDAYGGSPSTDRNLYVDKVGSRPLGAALYVDSTQTFTTTIPHS